MEGDGLRIFVGNLPFDVSRDEVVRFLSRAGPVRSLSLPLDNIRRTKGFAFCEFSSPKVAESAVRNLNDTEFHSMFRRAARPREVQK